MVKIERTTHQIDATGKALGRLATEIATLLRGKHKVNFQPHMDQGDIVQVSNAAKMLLTGKKRDQKTYRWHTNYPGGLKSRKLSEIMDTNPADALQRAVQGMIPRTKLRDSQLKRLIIKK